MKRNLFDESVNTERRKKDRDKKKESVKLQKEIWGLIKSERSKGESWYGCK